MGGGGGWLNREGGLLTINFPPLKMEGGFFERGGGGGLIEDLQ